MASEFSVVTAATTALVTTAEAKALLNIDHSADDTLIAALVAAATEEAQRACARSFITRTCRLVLHRWPCDNVIRLQYPPALTVTSIKYYDADGVEQTVDAADYTVITDVTPGIVVPAVNKAWPTASLRTYAPIRVTYTAGYGAAAANVDADLVALVKALVVVDYESRESISSQAQAQRDRLINAAAGALGWAE